MEGYKYFATIWNMDSTPSTIITWKAKKDRIYLLAGVKESVRIAYEVHSASSVTDGKPKAFCSRLC